MKNCSCVFVVLGIEPRASTACYALSHAPQLLVPLRNLLFSFVTGYRIEVFIAFLQLSVT
jgi:hypothetical protein